MTIFGMVYIYYIIIYSNLKQTVSVLVLCTKTLLIIYTFLLGQFKLTWASSNSHGPVPNRTGPVKTKSGPVYCYANFRH